MSEDMEVIHEFEREHLENAYETQKTYYDRNASPHDYDVDDFMQA